jgi:histone H3/H4
LTAQKNDIAARKIDPLWFQPEDVMHPMLNVDTVMAEDAKVLPEQVQIVEAALEKNNLTRSDVTPQAFGCLLEQARRFAIEILMDAQDYAFIANRVEIAKADLMLAFEFRPDHPLAVSTQVPKLNLLSGTVNRVPLPPIPTQCYSGIVLPPKHHQLTARTFDVVTSAQTARRMVQATPPPPRPAGSKKATSSKDSKQKPSYGAARGRQISIHLKSDAKKVETKKQEAMKKDDEIKKGGETSSKEERTTKDSSEAKDIKKEDEDVKMEDKKPEDTTKMEDSVMEVAVKIPAADPSDTPSTDKLAESEGITSMDIGSPSKASEGTNSKIESPSEPSQDASKTESPSKPSEEKVKSEPPV